MTTAQIKNTLAAAGKPVGTSQLYVYLNRLKIRPRARLRPAIYPADTPRRILRFMGITPASPLETAGSLVNTPTMKQLRQARAAAAKGGRR
jgi:hypothetical protein